MGKLFSSILGPIGTIFFGSNTIFTILGVLILIIVVPNFNQIKEKLGLETRTSLTTKLAIANQNTDKAKEANDALVASVNALGNSKKDSDIATFTLDAKDKATVKIADDILKNKQKAILALNKQQKLTNKTIKKHTAVAQLVEKTMPANSTTLDNVTNIEPMSDTPDNTKGVEDDPKNNDIDEVTPEEQEQYKHDVSSIQITAIWSAYCNFNQNSICVT